MFDILDQPPRLEIPPVRSRSVELLERELGVSGVLAQALARRGLDEPQAARAFMDASESHHPAALRGIGGAVELVLGHIARGSQITVHGDYDCDGVCATAILVGALRELRADVDWYLPDRLGDGYGLAAATVARLAERGTRLLITADCAITAVEEVALARAAGLDVLVTDHHSPRADGALPAAPIVHPALCDYPCPDLCATAVAAKLAQALRERAGLDGGERDSDLELVALATIADVVPLRGENRRLVRAGLRALAATGRPGLRALMAVASVAPLRVDERAVAFRLAPRINAAGRLYRADSALELLLTDDAERAAALAGELDHANAERRDVETRIRFEAEAQLSGTAPASAHVLAGEGWHPGVIGIVAARIAQRHHRPVVLIGLPAAGDGPASGSARSIPAFDLLAGLTAAGGELLRYGGHRAAAGLTIDPARVEAFRAVFVRHAETVLRPADLVGAERVDAIASASDVGLALAEELGRLAPFGAANPPVSLLLPAASFSDSVGFGGERRDQHARFTVASGTGRVRAVGFGGGPRPPLPDGEPVDATFTLEIDEWRGVVEPRLILRSARACAPAPIEILGEGGGYLERAFAELDRRLAPVSAASAAPAAAPVGSAGPAAAPVGSASPAAVSGGSAGPVAVPAASPGPAAARDARGCGIAAAVAGLVASGEPVLVLCADALARRRHLRARLGGFALAAYSALERGALEDAPREHVVLLDPPPTASDAAAAAALGPRPWLVWGAPELRFSAHIHEQEYGLRDPLAACYRELRNRGGATGRDLEIVLRGNASQPRSPELAGRMLAVLTEVGLIELDRKRTTAVLIPQRRVALEASAAYRACQRRLKDGLEYLQVRTTRQAA